MEKKAAGDLVSDLIKNHLKGWVMPYPASQQPKGSQQTEPVDQKTEKPADTTEPSMSQESAESRNQAMEKQKEAA
jgi:hypothetical protein